MARRKYAREKESSILAKNFNYIDEVVKLTGLSSEVVKVVLGAFRLSLLEEIADTVTSCDNLPEEIKLNLPSLGELQVSRLFEGRTDNLMYNFMPSSELHEEIKEAFYTGNTPTDDLIASKLIDNYLETYKNIVGGELTL